MSNSEDSDDAKKDTCYITVHCTSAEQNAVTTLVYNEFKGTRNMWNSAWIEYTVPVAEAERLRETLAKQGHKTDRE